MSPGLLIFWPIYHFYFYNYFALCEFFTSDITGVFFSQSLNDSKSFQISFTVQNIQPECSTDEIWMASILLLISSYTNFFFFVFRFFRNILGAPTTIDRSIPFMFLNKSPLVRSRYLSTFFCFCFL